MIDVRIGVVSEEQGGLIVDGIRVLWREGAAPAHIVFAKNRRVGRAHGDCVNEIIWRQHVVIVVCVHVPAHLQLPQVVDAINRLGAGFPLAQRGQQQTGKNRDDGDDNEEFDQGESKRAVYISYGLALFEIHRGGTRLSAAPFTTVRIAL